MFGYVVTTLLFASCLGQRHNDKGHDAIFSFNDFNNFGPGALHEGIRIGIVQPASFARPKEFERASFEGPKTAGGLRDFRFGDGHRGLLARDTKELEVTAVSGLALAARPKSSGDEKFKDKKTKIGQAFAHVSQSFGSPSDFKEIPVRERASEVGHDKFGHNGLSASHTTEFGNNRFLPSEGLGSFNVEKELDHRPPNQLGFVTEHGSGGEREFSGVHNRQSFLPGNFERFSESTQKVPHFIAGGGIHSGTNNVGSEIPHNGHQHFMSTPTNGGFPLNDHKFAQAPLHGGSSFDIPTRFDGGPGHDIEFSGHRQLGGIPNHRESLFNRNIGFGGGPTHSGSHINGQNRFNAQVGNGKNLIHNGPPFIGNLGLKESPSRGGGSNFDDSLVHDGKFPVHKFGVNGIQENKFGSAAFPFDGHQIFDEARANRDLIGHHGQLPKDAANSFIGNQPVPQKLSKDLPHFGNNGFNGNGFISNGFNGNGFNGNGFNGNGFNGNGFHGNGFNGNGFGDHGNGGIPFGGNSFDGNELGGNGFRSDGFVGNIVHGSPISFENAKQVNLKNLGVGAAKDGTVIDDLREFERRPRPLHDQHLFSNHFGPQLHQSGSLSNVDKQHLGFNEFGIGFLHGNPILNGPNRFPKGQIGIGSLQKEESVHSISPFNQPKQSGISSFQRGPFIGGPFQNEFSELNNKPEHLSSLSSISANKAINEPIKHGNSHIGEFSNTKPKGLGTDIIHIGSFDTVGLGKRAPSSDELKGVGSREFGNGFANSHAFFRTQKEFKDNAALLGRPKNIDKGVTHKRSHGFEQSPINGRTTFDQTKSFIHNPINRGTKDSSHGPTNTKSVHEDQKTLGGNHELIKPSPKRLTQIDQEAFKKPPGAENFQHKEPVKSGPFYISHREYANEGPKGITSAKVNIPTKPLNDVSPRGKLSNKNPKESSRGRVAING